MTTKVRFSLISPDEIEPNPQNPRQTWDEERLDQLAESIRTKGVLVPVTVYERAPTKYVLLDGERRLRAAKRINLKTIPAWITTHPDKVKNLEAMFHIHMERDDWTRIDALNALRRLISESDTKDPAELHKMTGISEENIVEMKRILDQPKEYQDLITDGTLPFIFFTELHQRIIVPLKTQRPGLFKKFNEQALTKLFVMRRKAGTLDNMTQLLRQVNAVIRLAGENGPTKASVHDKALERVLSDENYPIEDAYEDATGATLELEKFLRHCERFKDRLGALIKQPLTQVEKRALKRSLTPLLKQVGTALQAVKQK